MTSNIEEPPVEFTPSSGTIVEPSHINDSEGETLGPRVALMRVPTRTLPLLGILLGIGSIVLVFTLFTVHQGLEPDNEATRRWAGRTRFSVSYWLDHGYFRSFGLLVRPSAVAPGFEIYKSSTGGHMVTAFVVEKVYVWISGRPSWRLLALHNQIWTLLVASVIGLLGFRLAERMGVRPRLALTMALSVEIVHFTFPDNLFLYFEMNGKSYWLFFAVVFLLIEEQSIERRTVRGTIAQAVAAFLLTYMEYIAGVAFLSAFVVVTVLLSRKEQQLGRLVRAAILPALLALGIFGIQRTLVRLADVPTTGNDFLFRTGLDGSSVYYGDHLDIAYRRDPIRLNFPYNRDYLFRWRWLFFAGSGAVLSVLVLAMRGRVPTIATISLLSLLGTYLLYAALFSQAIMIHPYLFDVLLFTPLILALFVLAPALVESMTEQRGVAVVVVFFLAAWVSMVQLRRYALQNPRPAKVSFREPAGIAEPLVAQRGHASTAG